MARKRLIFVTMTGVLAALLSVALVLPAVSAADFANQAFKDLWAKTDANPGGHTYVWGPAPFTDGIQEPYKEASGGQRLVQYFDKGRMELGANNTVTAGLLSVELISGKQQNGDNTFVQRDPANVPVAGDPTNTFPTYADLAKVQAAEQNNNGKPVTKQYKSDGSFGTYDTKGDAQAVTTGFDDQTKHNIPKAFLDFRNAPDFGGIQAIGLAITEPVWANVMVNNKQTDVMMQAFERRVLTYTPSNPDGFKVEYGNIGRAYYAWRYPSGTSTPTGNGTPAAQTSSGLAVVAFADPSLAKPEAPVNLTVKVTQNGQPVPNASVHVDWKFTTAGTPGPTKTSDATTNTNGIANPSLLLQGVLGGTYVQVVVTVNANGQTATQTIGVYVT